MRCNYLSVFLLVILCVGCRTVNAPQSVSVKTISPCGVELYYSLGGLGSEVKSIFLQEGFKKIVLVNQRRIVQENNPWLFDEVILRSNIERLVPDSQSEEMIVLNWEGKAYKAIQAGPGHPDYERASEQFIAAYKLVKHLRPRTKVGYYGFPIRDYWNRDDAWRARNRSLDPFMANFEVLFPSIYDFYDSSTKRGSGDLDYVRENVEEALRTGSRIGKLVMPFVWHRYHTSNKTKRLQLIPLPEFAAHVGAAAGARFEDKSIDGLVWWSSEYSSFAKANRKKYADKQQMRSAWEAGSAKVLPSYFDAMRMAVEEKCQD